MRKHVAREGEKAVYRFSRPKMRFNYHPALVYQGYVEWEGRDFQGLPLPPEAFADQDEGWRADMKTMKELFLFHRRPEGKKR